MTEDEKLVSQSGSPILRHEEPEDGFHPPEREAEFLPEIEKHIEKYLGPVECVFHEIVSEFVHIDVHWVPPNGKRPFHTLVSSGMSDLPMKTPEAEAVPRHAELFVTLPASWRVGQAEFDDEANYWPIRQLKHLARFPHVYQTWLGYGHTIPNGDPPEPFDASTNLCGAMIFPSPTVDRGFHALTTSAGEEIAFFAVVPLHADEMAYKLREGADALVDRFDDHDVADVIDPARPSVCRRSWWNPFS